MGVFDKFLNVMKLNDDDGFDDDDFLDDEIDDDYEETKPKKRFFSKQDDDDDFDDYGYDESIPAKKNKTTAKKQTTASTRARNTAAPKQTSSSKISPMRTKKSAAGMNVCVIKPRSMEDAREITMTLLSNCTVVLNMEGLDLDLAQRIIDFSSGSCFAMSGSLQKISNYIFIVAPADVDISGDFQEILNGAFQVPPLGGQF